MMPARLALTPLQHMMVCRLNLIGSVMLAPELPGWQRERSAQFIPDRCCKSVHSTRSARNTNWWMVQPAMARSSGPKLSAARCLAASAAAVPPGEASGGSPVVEGSGVCSRGSSDSCAEVRLEGGCEASGGASAGQKVVQGRHWRR